MKTDFSDNESDQRQNPTLTQPPQPPTTATLKCELTPESQLTLRQLRGETKLACHPTHELLHRYTLKADTLYIQLKLTSWHVPLGVGSKQRVLPCLVQTSAFMHR